MPRGRHRHSPPLHRLLPPSAIASVSLLCALGPWVFTEPTVLRGLAAAAAATAIVGAVVMRRWDMQAGKQVADLTRARAGDEWRYEERVAELESDLDESRELRVKLEQRLRSKRTELAGLRNEHAALLRRYATAETERATALEGRRLLEIEAAPSPALPAARTAQDTESTGTPATRDIDAAESTDAVETDTEARETEKAEKAEETRETAEAVESAESAESGESAEPVEPAEEEPKAPAVFSPEGSKLFLRAQAALARFDTEAAKAAKSEDHAEEEPARTTSVEVAAAGGETEAAQEDEAQGNSEAADEHARAVAPHTADEDAPAPQNEVAESDEAKQEAPEEASADANGANDANGATNEANDVAGEAGVTRADDANANEAESARPEPSPTPAPAAEVGSALVRRPAAPVQRPSGHFAVPTAVAVVPATQPVRRPTAEGGFDFFGTKSASSPDTLESLQNEDLADVVGQEALALHKAESEGEFKPVDEASRGVGQVIDLTAHDETEVIDLQGLRSAVS
ncbi:hypothetical protein [Streptomyces sp. NPDC051677]|uniref:hypothetical protein n=1 Tax=Streptomyces sp. NPDC051677 TaxID=3365669 RepID=UPI0037CFA275